MDAVFIDQAGHKKNFLYQYDVDQTFIIEDFEYSTAPKAQFQIKSLKTSLSANSTIENGDLKVKVPDVLLKYGEDIVVYLYINDVVRGNVIETIFISVVPRKIPSDYTYISDMFTRTINGTTISDNFGVTDVAVWADKNTSNENRIGYFVSADYGLNGITVSKATSINNVYGVVVETPGFASNCNEDKIGNTGDLISKYAYICSYGFASVIDNGRCSVGGMCVPSNDGTATSSNIFGYKVLARIDNKHIFIFMGPSMGVINSNTATMNSHASNKNNPHTVTKAQVGLSEVPNVATNGQTPTYTEATSLSSLTSGEKLSIAFGKLSKAVTDFIAHLANKSNPHSITKSQVGLGNCDNTSDTNKPISTAQSAEFTRIEGLVNNAQSDIDTHAAKIDNPHGVTKAQVGLGNVDNTADIDKPISTAQSEEFERIEGLITTAQGDTDGHVARTDNPHNVTKAQVGLGNVDNTSDADKPISTATQNALDKKADLDSNGLVPLTQLPSSYTPSVHASTHFTGGTDPITPSDIGAATATHTHDASTVPIIDETTGTKYYFKMINGVFGLYAEGSDVNVLDGDNISY